MALDERMRMRAGGEQRAQPLTVAARGHRSGQRGPQARQVEQALQNGGEEAGLAQVSNAWRELRGHLVALQGHRSHHKTGMWNCPREFWALWK